jgi:predicted lipoprotein with Yx(FWY)xxD motif
MLNRIIPLAAAAFLLAGPAQAEIKTSQTALGPTLVNEAGMTVYFFDKDEGGKPACYAECAKNWPPVPSTAMKLGGDYSAVERTDGIKQLAYKGKPLYLSTKDAKPGDTAGEGVKGLWHAAKP